MMDGMLRTYERILHRDYPLVRPTDDSWSAGFAEAR